MKENLNSNLHKAKTEKNDEFYTRLEDIENEVKHYKQYFKDKVVYCNADDPRVSNFFHYFSHNFEHLGLKKLITTCYKSKNIETIGTCDEEHAVALIYEGAKKNGRVPDVEDIGIIELKGDGDFRSKESIEFLKEADIVVTNPPFSLFREYVAQLVEYEKDFLILGNMNAVTYKEIFPLIKEGKMWLGVDGRVQDFIIPKDAPVKTGHWVDDDGTTYQRLGNVVWYTNMEHDARREKIPLFRKYYPEGYPKYDNYDAINVDKVANIPEDYNDVMGVPISFLKKYNPDQFELVGLNGIRGEEEDILINVDGVRTPMIDGIAKYRRVFIRRKHDNPDYPEYDNY